MAGNPPPRVSSCFDAQTYLGTSNEYGNNKLNPDVGGPFVALANILINLLLPFLVRWSPEVTSSLYLLFSQTIPILLATLSSIGQKNLTLFDAHFTIAVTLSPVSVYVTGCCLLRRCGVETSLFRKIPSSESKAIIQWLGLVLIPLWFSVSVITSFSTTAFTNSFWCRGVTIPRYAEFLLLSSMTGALDIMGYRDLWDDLSKRKGLGFIFLLTLWVYCIYVTRHRQEIIKHWKYRYQEMVAEDPKWRLLRQSAMIVWYIPKTCWDVVMAYHPVMLWWLWFLVHWSWMLSILNAISFDWGELSYGQFISIFAPIPGLYAFSKIIHNNWRNIGRFFFEIPRFVSQGLCFIITGKQEWTEREKEFERDYFSWSKWRWAMIIFTWLTYAGLHAVWIYFYVRAGTLPNERNLFNEPHSNWKPVSILLYINGYFVSISSMFIAIAAFDYYQKWFFFLPHLYETKSYSTRVIRAIGLTVTLLLALIISGGPLFSPMAALPLSQEWHWIHQCENYPVEIILQGQPNPNISSTISFYATVAEGQPRQHIYDFEFSGAQEYQFLQYRPVDNTTLPQEFETSIKTLFLNISQHQFFGCSSTFSETSLQSNLTLGQQESICSDALGTYAEDPYLFFNITSGSANTFLRVFDKEFAWDNDAPAFSLHFANEDGSLRDTILLYSALTKRNSPSTLKVCSNAKAASAEVLGPLTFFMGCLNRFAAFIDRPKVFPLD